MRKRRKGGRYMLEGWRRGGGIDRGREGVREEMKEGEGWAHERKWCDA